MQRKKTFYLLSRLLILGIVCLGILGTVFFLKTSDRSARASATLATGLHVVGNQIKDGNGTTIVPHGVDRMGTEYQCTKGGTTNFDGPVDQAAVTAMLNWNVNIVRVPLNEDCWLGINGFPANGTSSSQYHTDIVNWVNLLNQNGIMVIVELHWNAPGSQQATGQEPMPDLDHAPAFWTSVANTFKSNSSVLFDIYNEPYTDSWSCWKNGSSSANSGSCPNVGFAVAGMQTLVNTVRGTGATNIIMLGGLAYSNDLSGWLSNKPSDSQNNLVASAHIYNFNACNSTSCWNSQIAPVKAQVPVLTGELGENDCASGFINTLMSWLDGQGIGYLAWTWTATGNCSGSPALITDYSGTPTNYGQGYKTHLLSLPNNGGGNGNNITDPLNDFSKIYAHSSNLTFDTTNTTYFNNDNSRLDRTVTTAEWATWRSNGMTQFQADTYYWPSQTGVSDFQFFASADNSNFTQVSPQSNNLGGDWTHIQYTLNLPAGTNYVKVVFPTNATNAWDPQISQVSYNGGGSSSTPTPTPTNTPTATPTSTPTATPTSTPTSTPVTGAACNITYTIPTQWQGGFTGNIDIKNTGTSTINGWTLTFTFPSGQQVTNGWNATFTQQGAQVSATNVSYNATIAPGATTSIGFNASVSGNNTSPTSFSLNGSLCTNS